VRRGEKEVPVQSGHHEPSHHRALSTLKVPFRGNNCLAVNSITLGEEEKKKKFLLRQWSSEFSPAVACPLHTQRRDAPYHSGRTPPLVPGKKASGNTKWRTCDRHGFSAIYEYFANPCFRILLPWDKYYTYSSHDRIPSRYRIRNSTRKVRPQTKTSDIPSLPSPQER